MAKKSKKRKYSKGASKEVENEVRRYKKGTAKSGKRGKGGKVKSSQASDRHRPLESAQEGEKGTEEEEKLNCRTASRKRR